MQCNQVGVTNVGRPGAVAVDTRHGRRRRLRPGGGSHRRLFPGPFHGRPGVCVACRNGPQVHNALASLDGDRRPCSYLAQWAQLYRYGSPIVFVSGGKPMQLYRIGRANPAKQYVPHIYRPGSGWRYFPQLWNGHHTCTCKRK